MRWILFISICSRWTFYRLRGFVRFIPYVEMVEQEALGQRRTASEALIFELGLGVAALSHVFIVVGQLAFWEVEAFAKGIDLQDDLLIYVYNFDFGIN